MDLLDSETESTVFTLFKKTVNNLLTIIFREPI